MKKIKLIGPFIQILTLDNLPLKGPLKDSQLEIIPGGGILIENEKIDKVLSAEEFKEITKDKNHLFSNNIDFLEIKKDLVLMPGLVDAHTHLCWAGNRAKDYSERLSGVSYEMIAKKGGGILSTVEATRKATKQELEYSLKERCEIHLKNGVTTCEVKSGYGLDVENEIKILKAIKSVDLIDLVPTCLAAHLRPPEFSEDGAYLNYLADHLLPIIKSNQLCDRVDIFIDKLAFSPELAMKYLKQAKALGFMITVHANQFSQGGVSIASEIGAISADHLEIIDDSELISLEKANVIANVLPGASIGLGSTFAPARRMLDVGLTLVISSDWNPGSAPMGDLLLQASIIGSYEKLTMAETLAAITCRSAAALELTDRGRVKSGFLADLIAFPCKDICEILYHQGTIKPSLVWKKGRLYK